MTRPRGLLGTAASPPTASYSSPASTGVEVGHRTARAIGVEHLSLAEARALLAAREFPAASIGPKVQAAVEFVAAGGREAIITSPPALRAALDGRARHAGRALTGRPAPVTAPPPP